LSFQQRLKKSLKFFLIPRVIDPLIRLLFRSARFEIQGLNAFLKNSKATPTLLALWHQNILIMPYLLSHELQKIQACAVISKSRDGELLESLKSTLPNVETIRVSHDSRHGALKAMLDALQSFKVIVITPDGPQGPWKELKPGLLQASAWTKAHIWCLSWSCRYTLTLPTQDKMKLPLPFQKITLKLADAGSYETKDPEVAQKAKIYLG
jgi:lysophospholipid acyltransferase (LPLAT)-like uncharacterized protein